MWIFGNGDTEVIKKLAHDVATQTLSGKASLMDAVIYVSQSTKGLRDQTARWPQEKPSSLASPDKHCLSRDEDCYGDRGGKGD